MLCVSFGTYFLVTLLLGFSGWGPYAYFRALEETRSTRRVSHPVDEVRTQSVVLQEVNKFGQNNHALGPIDLESGKL